MTDEAGRLPPIRQAQSRPVLVLLEIAEIADFGDGDVVQDEAGTVDRVVGDVLETDQHLLPSIRGNIHPFLDPFRCFLITAPAGIGPAEGVPIGVSRCAGGSGEDFPGLPSVGANLHVGVVPVFLQVVPGPEFQRGLVHTR